MKKLVVSKQTLEQLEFDKIERELLLLCKGEPAKIALAIEPWICNIEEIRSSLDRINDLIEMSRHQESFDLSFYEDINESLVMLSKEAYVLSSEEIIRILYVVNNYDGFDKHFNIIRKKKYNHIFQFGKVEDYTDKPRVAILSVFDETGAIRVNASPELAKIFKREESLQREQDKLFVEMLKKYKAANLLVDNGETIRNGRRVLILPAERKRMIDGIIHDESASGKTVYVEPAEMTALNNEVFSIENEKRAEIRRILKSLCDQLREFLPLLTYMNASVVKLDVAISKAKFSYTIRGEYPQLTEEPILHLKEVRHPMLYLQEVKGGHKTIPFDLELKRPNRMVLISGPNAGGKSVTLKAVGLIHLMLCRGLMLPLRADSEVGIFHSIFADIGDQQSIDQGLSTFSSHLHNLKHVVDRADEKSLVLLDEIGSGTDPNAGSAIAEGVLMHLLNKKVHGILTTHYSSLKIFVFKQKGIVNGAMLFDKVNLSPTYKLKVGKPGSSYAFEVASQVGLASNIIHYARKKLGKRENLVEDLLIDLQEDRAMLDEQLLYVNNEKDRLDKLIKSYDELNRDFQVKRKKLQVRAKELEFQKTSKRTEELHELVKKLEKEKNIEKAKKLKEEAKEARAQQSTDIFAIKKEIMESSPDMGEVAVGDYVRMLDSTLSGEVLQVKGDILEVLFGMIPMNVKMSEVVKSMAHLEIVKNKRINLKGVAFEHNFSPKIDIRGYTAQDAEDTLQAFFDKALLNNARYLEVVHGKGSGILKKVLVRKMKEYRDIQKYWHPEDSLGGESVTMIKM